MYTRSGELVIISSVKKAKNPFRSLRVQVFLALIIIGTIPGIFFRLGIIGSYEKRIVQDRKDEMLEQCNILSNQIAYSNYLSGKDMDLINGELNQLAASYNGRVLVIDSNFKIVRDTFSLDGGKTEISPDIIKTAKTGQPTSSYNKKDSYIEVIVPIVHSTKSEVVSGMIFIHFSAQTIRNNISVMQRQWDILMLIIVTLIIMIAFFLSKHFVAPFAQLTKSIDCLQDSNMEEQISVDTYKETILLSEAFNKVMKRLKLLDDSRQEFVSNVSHELKTPLTSMKVLADSLLVQEEVPNELYKEFMTDIAEEIDRENKIITDLLSLVKMDKKASDLNIQPVNINELLELLLRRLRPIAARRNIELVFESFRPVTAEIDEVKLSLAISNLVENAIKYNKDNGWVHVSLNADHKYFFLKVEDSGMGIPEKDQEHIFERFYRVDKSHSREIGGTGLGLAITRSAILMHRGAIKVHSQEGEGTIFNVRVPLNYIA